MVVSKPTIGVKQIVSPCEDSFITQWQCPEHKAKIVRGQCFLADVKS